MKIHALTLIVTLLASVSAYSQQLKIEIDLDGNFTTEIVVGHHSSLTLDPKGDIVTFSVNNRDETSCDNSSLESSNLHSNSGRVTRVAGLDVEYDFHTERISKIGDLKITYDFHTELISRIGDIGFEYSFHTNRISEIGDASIDYDFRTDKISEIGDVKFTYDFPSDKLESVGNADFKYEYETDRRGVHNNLNDCRGKHGSNHVVFSYAGVKFVVKISE